MPLLAIAAASQTIGSFMIVQTPDPINDKPRASAATSDGKTAISVSCNMSQGKGLRIAFSDEDQIKGFAGPSMAYMTFRFDKNKPVIQVWDRADQMAFTKKESQVREFLSELVASTSVIVRVDRPDGTTSDREFGTIGAREAVSAVAAVCGIASPT